MTYIRKALEAAWKHRLGCATIYTDPVDARRHDFTAGWQAALAALGEGAEPRGCPTPGACSCPPSPAQGELEELRQERDEARALHRWTIERAGDDLLICDRGHEKTEPCEFKRWVPEARATAAEAALRDAQRTLRTLESWRPPFGEEDNAISLRATINHMRAAARAALQPEAPTTGAGE